MQALRGKMNTILILGGSGFIGANLSEYFSQKDIKIINFSRSPAKIKHENIINVCGDCKDVIALNSIFETYKIDVVLHSLTSFTAMDTIDSCQELLSTNLSAFIDLVNIAKKHNVNKLVYVSSGGSIYGVADAPIKETHEISPVSFYGWMKEACERYLEFAARSEPKFNYLILRPANVYGKYQKIERIIGVALFNAIQGNPMNIYGDIHTKKDYIHIDDFCEITEKLVRSSKWNEVYNIGSGVGTSTKDILEYAQLIVGKELSIKHFDQKTGDVSYNILDIDKMKNDVSKYDFISVETGMRDMYDYVCKIARSN